MAYDGETSAHQILCLYFQSLNQLNVKESALKGILTRFVVPELGGPGIQGPRSTVLEIEAALNFLQGIKSDKIMEFENLVKVGLVRQNIKKDNQRKYLYYVRQFVAWCIDHNYCKSSVQSTRPIKELKLHENSGNAHRNWHDKGSKKYHSKSKKHSPYRLCCSQFPEDYFNLKLANELENFYKYRSRVKGCREATIIKEKMHIEHILGWLHRHKYYSLDELSLNIICPYVTLLVDISDFSDINEFLLAKIRQKEISSKKADEGIKLLQNYLDFLDGNPNSAASYIEACIAIATFFYHDTINSDDYPQARDIPLIRKLRSLKKTYSNLADQQGPTIPFEEKSVSWETAIEVMEKLRLRYEQKYCYYTCSKTNKVIKNHKRTDYALQRDLQDFLTVAFIVVRPPLRASNYFKLENGKTLKFGRFIDEKFIPAKTLGDPTALWYIYLPPENQKQLGISHKGLRVAWWGHIPNVVYKDGKNFYSYINEWLTWGREYKEEIEHDFFFRGTSNFKPLNNPAWRNRIHDIFYRYTDVSVTPHAFRAMYVTFLRRKRATEDILEGAACAQLHSRKTQRQHYDKSLNEEKMRPVMEFHEQELQILLKSSNIAEKYTPIIGQDD